METLDQEQPEIVETIDTEHEIPNTTEVLKPHPSLLIAVVTTASSLVRDDPDQDIYEVLYLTTKEFVKSTMKLEGVSNDAHVVFVYYVHAYVTYRLSQWKGSSSSSKEDLPQVAFLYNEGALSLFDIYLKRPYDILIRRMLPVVTESLCEIAVKVQSQQDNPVREIIGYLSTMALLSQTVSSYVKGKRRPRNFSYISWLKTFFEKAVSTPDLSFMKDDPILSQVVTDVTHRAKVITIS